MTAELWQLSASELRTGYACRAISPVEVTTTLLRRIERLNDRLAAYLIVDYDGAVASARAAEAAWMQSDENPLLCGIPVHVKDTIEMAGFPTTYGSLAFRDNIQPDAEIVRRLRATGAVILGKTNTPEFALLSRTENRLGAPAVNPWDLSRSAGGSTGGGAAAVAAGLGALCIGTDSGGSVRQPAAYHGIFALKPSFQRIPSVQRWRASPGRSHNGPITRTVADSALMMQALAGSHPDDPDSGRYPDADYASFSTGTMSGTRVAVSATFGRDMTLEADQLRILEDAKTILRELGCTLIDADPPLPQHDAELSPGIWAYAADHYAAAEDLMPDFWAKHADDLTTYARPIYEAGQIALAWQARRHVRRDRAYGARVRTWFADYDFLLSPCSEPAPLNTAAADVGRMPFLPPFNHAYNPAASIPIGLDGNGLPLSVQLVGRLGDDVGTLRLASLFERANPWSQRWPAYSGE